VTPGAAVKVKVTLKQATKTQRGVELSYNISLNSALDGGDWSAPGPGRFTPVKDPVSIV
jgi:hypothetical protein